MVIWVSLPFPRVIGESDASRAERIKGIVAKWWDNETPYILCEVGNKEKEEDTSPYALYLFYRVDSRRRELQIQGTLWGHEVGKSLNYKQEKPTALLPPSSSSLLSRRLFYFPSISNLLRVDEETLREVVATRLDWLLHAYWMDNFKLPFELNGEDEEAASFSGLEMVMHAFEACLLHIPFTCCSVPKMRARFEAIRREAEKYRFFRRFAQFSREAEDLEALLTFNSISLERTATAERGDLQSFFQRFGGDVRPPLFFYRVPMENVPSVSNFVLHDGGTIHLSYLDLAPWIWNTYDIGQKMRTSKPLPPASKFPYWMHDMATHIFDVMNRVEQGGGKPIRKGIWVSTGNYGKRKEGEEDYIVESVEALVECLPPCLRNLVSERFPRNMERLFILPILASAGLAVEAALELFAYLNKRYPKKGGGGESLKSRFDVEIAWKANETKKILPLACKTIIKREERREFTCPYVAETQTTESWSNRCACKREAFIPDIEDMYAPHMFLAYKLKQRGQLATTEVRKKLKHVEIEEVECQVDECDLEREEIEAWRPDEGTLE